MDGRSPGPEDDLWAIPPDVIELDDDLGGDATRLIPWADLHASADDGPQPGLEEVAAVLAAARQHAPEPPSPRVAPAATPPAPRPEGDLPGPPRRSTSQRRGRRGAARPTARRSLATAALVLASVAAGFAVSQVTGAVTDPPASVTVPPSFLTRPDVGVLVGDSADCPLYAAAAPSGRPLTTSTGQGVPTARICFYAR
jgi:hypothetical protein